MSVDLVYQLVHVKKNTYIKLPNITEIMALELFSVSKYSILKLESSEK